jgi:hypothetical protein
MANCNDLFQEFCEEITITSSKNENLKKGKDAIEKEIKDYFSETLEVQQPDFFLQGSYALKTLINPINPQDEYDLDDGVHLNHLDDDKSEWPKPEEIGNYIVEAVKDHTEQKPQLKKNCVRVIYANDYHIDLPIYCENRSIIYLACLEKNEWVMSDPKKFKDWFYSRLEKTEQIRSCIKYLKAWKDFRGCDLKSIHITALVGLNHLEIKDRDDESLTQTLQKIVTYIKSFRAIYNPIDTTENFISDWDNNKINKIIEILEKLHIKALEAINEKDKSVASKKWITVFGTRFPEYDEEEKERKGIKFTAVPLVRETRPPAPPWSQS